MLFSIITLTFNRPHFLKEIKASIFSQTHQNFEWIIINNASTPETQSYLRELKAGDARVVTVDYEINQYDPKSPSKFMEICINAALKKCHGELVFFISDDDLLSPNYLEAMIRLFKENPDCRSAAGLPLGFKNDFKPENILPRNSNFRPRYMPGHELALKNVQGKNKLFSAPGNIFTFRLKDLIEEGGVHAAIELQELYSLMPFGVTGFDENAFLYWRYHANQLNISFTEKGNIGLHDFYDLIHKKNIYQKWQTKFGNETAKTFIDSLMEDNIKRAAQNFLLALFALNIKAAGNIFSETHEKLSFLISCFGQFFINPRNYLAQTKKKFFT